MGRAHARSVSRRQHKAKGCACTVTVIVVVCFRFRFRFCFRLVKRKGVCSPIVTRRSREVQPTKKTPHAEATRHGRVRRPGWLVDTQSSFVTSPIDASMEAVDVNDHDARYEPVNDCLLGTGSYGYTKLMREKATGKMYALKYIERGEKITEHVRREITNHRNL